MEQQRKRILDLQHNQDAYSVLKRDADSARDTRTTPPCSAAAKLGCRAGSIKQHRDFEPPHSRQSLPSFPILFLMWPWAVILGSMLGAGVSITRERLIAASVGEMTCMEGAGIAVLAELPREPH